jgi:hypothetical protein
MADENITIEGIEETLTALDRISDAMAHEVIQPALLAAGVPVLKALSTKTPVRTGDLLKHMSMSLKGEGKDWDLQIGFPGAAQKVRWLEYGHHEVGHAPDHKELGEATPHPFMRPALEESVDAALEAFKDSVDKSIDALAKKNGLSENAA